MGGMTQSRFCLRSPSAFWRWGHGSSTSFGGCEASGAALRLPFCSRSRERGERSQRSLGKFHAEEKASVRRICSFSFSRERLDDARGSDYGLGEKSS